MDNIQKQIISKTLPDQFRNNAVSSTGGASLYRLHSILVRGDRNNYRLQHGINSLAITRRVTPTLSTVSLHCFPEVTAILASTSIFRHTVLELRLMQQQFLLSKICLVLSLDSKHKVGMQRTSFLDQIWQFTLARIVDMADLDFLAAILMEAAADTEVMAFRGLRDRRDLEDHLSDHLVHLSDLPDHLLVHHLLQDPWEAEAVAAVAVEAVGDVGSHHQAGHQEVL